jgi:hypothetical protein
MNRGESRIPWPAGGLDHQGNRYKERTMADFDKNERGEIILQPIKGFSTIPTAGMNVLLQIRYADGPDAIETGPIRRVQILLTLQGCLDLADSLRIQVARILGDLPASGDALH